MFLLKVYSGYNNKKVKNFENSCKCLGRVRTVFEGFWKFGEMMNWCFMSSDVSFSLAVRNCISQGQTVVKNFFKNGCAKSQRTHFPSVLALAISCKLHPFTGCSEELCTFMLLFCTICMLQMFVNRERIFCMNPVGSNNPKIVLSHMTQINYMMKIFYFIFLIKMFLCLKL